MVSPCMAIKLSLHRQVRESLMPANMRSSSKSVQLRGEGLGTIQKDVKEVSASLQTARFVASVCDSNCKQQEERIAKINRKLKQIDDHDRLLWKALQKGPPQVGRRRSRVDKRADM